MDVVVERCAGIDVHKEMVAVCVRVPGPDGERVAESAEFSTFTLVGGSRDPAVLADVARGQLRRKLPQLQAALAGRFGSHHALLVAEVLSLLDYLDESIGRLSAEIDRVIAPFAEHRDRLASAPGVDQRMAEAIIGEIGVDMTRFATPGHLASWAGMCPGQHESAGKSRHGTARHGNSWLQRHLTMAAMSASRTKGTYLTAQYRRIAGRRGKQRARKAVGHSLLVGVWHILADTVEWDDLGADYYDRRQTPAHRAHRKLADLRSLGWNVTTNDDGTITLNPPAAA
jgi:transposase